jgi:opacity protein-like surface antigen
MTRFKNWHILISAGCMSLPFYCSNVSSGSIDPIGQEPISGGIYIGAFGGAGFSDNDDVSQNGVALYPDGKGGPFNVSANGMNHESAGIGGAHIGYEWRMLSVGNGEVIPAAEFEGIYLGTTQNALLFNPNNRLVGHSFIDNFPMDIDIFFTNAVLTYRSSVLGRFAPYIGAGVGAAKVLISNADSTQVVPFELGINHFNSNPNAADWTFAAQAKIGLQFTLNEHWRLFGEYRLIDVSTSDYIFGSTQYTTHIPTTPWNVHFKNMDYNTALAGIQYKV